MNRNYALQLVISLLISLLPINSSYSEDISEIDIYGYKISHSLLDYFTIEEIQNMDKEAERGQFIRHEYSNKTRDSLYDKFAFIVKKDDPSFILYSISAGKLFGKDNLELCESIRNKLVKKISKRYPKINPISYDSPYSDVDDGKSVAYVTDFNLREGSIRIYCVDWSPHTEKKRGYVDNFQYEISSKAFLKSIDRSNLR